MNFDEQSWARIAYAQRVLNAARRVPAIKRGRDLAEAARSYARSVKATKKTLFCAACLTLRAEHKLGTELAQTDLAKAAPGNQYTGKKKLDHSHTAKRPLYLRDLKVSGSDSHRAQQLAVLTGDELELWLKRQCAAGVEPTLAAARRYAREIAVARASRRERRRKSTGRRRTSHT